MESVNISRDNQNDHKVIHGSVVQNPIGNNKGSGARRTARLGVKASIPNSEVSEKRPPRRRLTAAYKLRILDAADACKGTSGAVGRLLRSEGLYSGMLGQWRKAREAGILTGLSPRKRGVKPREANPFVNKIRELEHDKIELEKRLEISQKIIETQKKIAEIFTSLSQAPSNGKKS
jgi:transposase